MQLVENIVNSAAVGLQEDRVEVLYENAFQAFARFAAVRHTSFEDARDIFHDAMVIYCEKASEPGFGVRGTPEAYIVGIAKHLWIRKFHRDKKSVSLDSLEREVEIPPDYFPDRKEIRLLNFLQRAGTRCMDLLRRFYYEKTSLKEIAAALGYRTEHSAAVQKYKCIGKLRETIKARSIGYEDIDH